VSTTIADLQSSIDSARTRLALPDADAWSCGYWYGVISARSVAIATGEGFAIAKAAQEEISAIEHKLKQEEKQ